MDSNLDYSQLLSKIYYDTKNSASFSGLEKLYNEAVKHDKSIRRENVKDWLNGELTYTLHKPALRKFKRNRIIVERINEQFEADLVDMRELAKLNDNYNYILTVIDCFSKYAFAIPLKNKTGSEIIRALKIIFKERTCEKFRSDRGTEFLNKQVLSYMKQMNINQFTSYDQEVKCAIVERFNRTLKGKMFKYFTSIGKRKYIDVLPNFIISYNNSYHRTIKMRPIDVSENNEKQVFYNIYGVGSLRDILLNKKSEQNKLKVGDMVRKKYTLKPMDKSYYPTWTDQIFTIDNTIKGENRPVLVLKDYSGKLLSQKFYPEELQKIRENLHRIEKIITTRNRLGRKEHFVKWLNYPNRYNSWILDSELQDINNG